MINYRRIYTPGATWFFTINPLLRHNIPMLIENIDLLRVAFKTVKKTSL